MSGGWLGGSPFQIGLDLFPPTLKLRWRDAAPNILIYTLIVNVLSSTFSLDGKSGAKIPKLRDKRIPCLTASRRQECVTIIMLEHFF